MFESDSDSEFEDTVFPSGSMEIVFNLGKGIWESLVKNKYFKTPQIELWGQITKPLAIKSRGQHTMLGIRFYPHSAAYFLREDINLLNNQISDASDLLGTSIKNLQETLIETPELKCRIMLIENFLLRQLALNEQYSLKIDKVGQILNGMKSTLNDSNISHIASRHGISTRYLHKLVYEHTGLSPKFYNKINRFQLSLKLITKKEQPLTSIAYDCGYFDQSHFIKDFKSFTGVTPSAYLVNDFPVNQIFLQ